jgi:hypothetical protein
LTDLGRGRGTRIIWDKEENGNSILVGLNFGGLGRGEGEFL